MYNFLGNQAMMVAWKDNVIVYMLTDAVGKADDEDFMCIRRSSEERIYINIPMVVELYNAWKSLVDRYNGKRAEADILTHFQHWWFRIFWNVPVASAENNGWKAMVVYGQRGEITFLKFRQELALTLLSDHISRNKLPRQLPDPNVEETHTHEIACYRQSRASDPKRPRYTHCKQMKDKSKPCECSMMCKQCEVALHLECFYVYHKIKK